LLKTRKNRLRLHRHIFVCFLFFHWTILRFASAAPYCARAIFFIPFGKLSPDCPGVLSIQNRCQWHHQASFHFLRSVPLVSAGIFPTGRSALFFKITGVIPDPPLFFPWNRSPPSPHSRNCILPISLPRGAILPFFVALLMFSYLLFCTRLISFYTHADSGLSAQRPLSLGSFFLRNFFFC